MLEECVLFCGSETGEKLREWRSMVAHGTICFSVSISFICLLLCKCALICKLLMDLLESIYRSFKKIQD